MLLQTSIFLLLGFLILALLVVNAVLFWHFNKTKKKIDELLENGKIKDFKDIFLSQREKHKELEEKIKEAFLKIQNVEALCEISLQKVGLVRFNPFNDLGGNQSFVVALLDNKDSGFVISSLFVNDGNRVYAKAVKAGKAEYKLSKEESEAVAMAINSK